MGHLFEAGLLCLIIVRSGRAVILGNTVDILQLSKTGFKRHYEANLTGTSLDRTG